MLSYNSDQLSNNWEKTWQNNAVFNVPSFRKSCCPETGEIQMEQAKGLASLALARHAQLRGWMGVLVWSRGL